jgi:dimethylargininase
LHLRTALGALPNGTILGGSIEVDDKSLIKSKYMTMPEDSGAEILILGDNHVMVSLKAVKSALLIKLIHKLDVTQVDITEFEKLDGCPTCLSVRIRELPEGSLLLS